MIFILVLLVLEFLLFLFLVQILIPTKCNLLRLNESTTVELGRCNRTFYLWLLYLKTELRQWLWKRICFFLGSFRVFFNWNLVVIGIIWIGLLTVCNSMSLLIRWENLLELTRHYEHSRNKLHSNNICAIVEHKLIEVR